MTTSLSAQIHCTFVQCSFPAKSFLARWCPARLTTMFIALFLAATVSFAATFAVKPPARLKCESMSEPLGIDITSPRLSWQLQDDRRGALQTAYQIRVATSKEQLQRGESLVWDSGRVASSESVNVSYGGPALQSRQRYYWQVRVWDLEGKVGPYSAPGWWEMGLLTPSDWSAKWIAEDNPMTRGDYEPDSKWIWATEEDALTQAVPGVRLFRFQFTLTEKPKDSMLLICAKDHLRVWVNGKPVVDSSDSTNALRERTEWQFSRNLSLAPYLETGTNAPGRRSNR